MGTRMKKNDLTNQAMHGWLGVPEQYLATSPAWYAYKLGEYLARTGSMAPCDVRMGRGYQIHANNMLFAFDAKNAITRVDGNNLVKVHGAIADARPAEVAQAADDDEQERSGYGR